VACGINRETETMTLGEAIGWLALIPLAAAVLMFVTIAVDQKRDDWEND
jgi:hypothetical protein